MALNLLKSQIIPLVEKFEPELQSILVKTLQSVKASNPAEADLFYTNWKLLDAAIEQELGPAVPPMQGGEESTSTTVVPESEPVAQTLPEPSPPIIEPTGPTGPVLPEATGPSFTQETGPTGPTIIQRITEIFSPETGATGPAGGKKHRKRKTAKQHKKRTHRVKHRKH